MIDFRLIQLTPTFIFRFDWVNGYHLVLLLLTLIYNLSF